MRRTAKVGGIILALIGLAPVVFAIAFIVMMPRAAAPAHPAMMVKAPRPVPSATPYVVCFTVPNVRPDGPDIQVCNQPSGEEH